MYWVNKYNILRRRTIHTQISVKLSDAMTEMLEYSLIIYGISNLVFFIYITNEDASANGVICVLIGLVYAFVPKDFLNKLIFKLKESEPNKMLFEEAEADEFETDYNRTNPATS